MRFTGLMMGLLAATLLAGCDSLEWGGIDVAIERPAPPPRDTVAPADTVRPDTTVRLPAGPVLFHVRRLDRMGRARIEPIAEAVDTGLAPLRTRRPDLAERYGRAFTEEYYGPGALYMLIRDGARVGTFVVEAASDAGAAACPRLVASGHVELRPFADTLSEFLAWPAGSPAPGDSLQLPRFRADMRELSAILADRLIDQRGVAGDWRIRAPALLKALRVGDGELGFAATFVNNDSVAVGPPADSAGMAFLVSDHSPARGYLPLYFEADWYGPGGKRVLRWVDRLDVLDGPGAEWLVRAYGDASSWYEVIGSTPEGRAAVWSSRDPVCDAQSPAATAEE